MQAFGFEIRLGGVVLREETVPVRNFMDATLALTEVLDILSDDPFGKLTVLAAWQSAANDECPCERPGCGNVVIPVSYLEGSELILFYTAV